MKIRIPEWSSVERFFKDPEILTAEFVFLLLTLSNIFVMYQLLLDVVPFPIFVTWWQLAQGLFMAWSFGLVGDQFPKLQYFPRVELKKELFKELAIPTSVYLLMLALANVVLSRTPCIATFPVIVSFTVVLHHITRFVGCGEEYMRLRWLSMGILLTAFIIGCTDPMTVGAVVLPWAVLYAVTSAIFRGCYLQKVMHIVEGQGNILHNHQHLVGVVFLPILWLIVGEWRVVTDLPSDFSSLRTWQTWGCLITVGTLPFIKNIISNRLVRKTGQGPWRALEVASILLVFLFGIMCFNTSPGWQGWIAIFLTIAGRTVGMYDVLINAADAEEMELRGGGQDPTAVVLKDNPMQEQAASMDMAERPFLSLVQEDPF